MDPKGNTEDAEMRDQGEAFYVVSGIKNAEVLALGFDKNMRKASNICKKLAEKSMPPFQVKFKPKCEGAHALSILHRDAHVNGE